MNNVVFIQQISNHWEHKLFSQFETNPRMELRNLRNWENEDWGNQHGYMASWETPVAYVEVFFWKIILLTVDFPACPV